MSTKWPGCSASPWNKGPFAGWWLPPPGAAVKQLLSSKQAQRNMIFLLLHSVSPSATCPTATNKISQISPYLTFYDLSECVNIFLYD